ARELGVSRPIVVDAYAQLAGEGYLELRPGALARITGCAGPCRPPATRRADPAPEPRYDFRPGVPDLSSFPRSAWLRSLREALAGMRDADLGYTDPQGTEVLRLALRDYLGRVRGVAADAGRVVVTSGWAQGRMILCRALAAMGARRIAVEDPCHDEVRQAGVSAGLELVPVPVDGEGLRVDLVERAEVDAALVTPAHQYPTGAVLSGARRGALLDWLRRREAIAIEDDYDAEYRYDRAPVGRCRGWTPSASSTPARRARRSRRHCGWAGWWCRPGCWRRCGGSSGRPISASRGSSSTPSPIFSSGASWTATSGGCGCATAPSGIRWWRRWPRRCPKCGCTGSGRGCMSRSSCFGATRDG
ncbi:MAG TPA: PLP-dependent aminotransferase family protein, partial [Gemmatimonadales bacterium]|nr:PLP-dependent aminotransferase family protein [Gemmatimonadales bacterium]